MSTRVTLDCRCLDSRIRALLRTDSNNRKVENLPTLLVSTRIRRIRCQRSLSKVILEIQWGKNLKHKVLQECIFLQPIALSALISLGVQRTTLSRSRKLMSLTKLMRAISGMWHGLWTCMNISKSWKRNWGLVLIHISNDVAVNEQYLFS